MTYKSEFVIDPSCGNISTGALSVELVDAFLANLRHKIISGHIENGLFSRKAHVTKMRFVPLWKRGMTATYKHTIMIEFEDVFHELDGETNEQAAHICEQRKADCPLINTCPKNKPETDHEPQTMNTGKL